MVAGSLLPVRTVRLRPRECLAVVAPRQRRRCRLTRRLYVTRDWKAYLWVYSAALVTVSVGSGGGDVIVRHFGRHLILHVSYRSSNMQEGVGGIPSRRSWRLQACCGEG
jgi:hypothetical protein